MKPCVQRKAWSITSLLRCSFVWVDLVSVTVLSSRVLTARYQTRWGVGFGPRDCSDYQTGISKIPIERLTDADKKWMLSAEYGGTGGKPIESGIVVEEPDIEIGAGVSSKGLNEEASCPVSSLTLL